MTEKVERFIRRTGSNRLRKPSRLYDDLLTITTEMVDKLISVALDLINPQHLRNWFASCCYCTS
ncbi:hypothetical protein N0Y54_31720 [Nostoc punctiforme UO1]